MNSQRPAMRSTRGPQRAKNADENAISKLKQQISSAAVNGTTRSTRNTNLAVVAKNGHQRPALGEVTTKAVNRKEAKSKLLNKAKEAVEAGVKRSRSSNLLGNGPQRVPLATNGRTAISQSQTTANVRTLATRSTTTTVNAPKRTGLSTRQSQRILVSEEPIVVPDDDEDEAEEEQDEIVPQSEMDVIEEKQAARPAVEVIEVVEVPQADESSDMEEVECQQPEEAPRYVWPEVSPGTASRYQVEIAQIKDVFEDMTESHDETMCNEYAEEIFQYMSELEETILPNPDYMDGQGEISWEMRETLVDWLLQVHIRYHMLPETLWIAINIIDRFLTSRVVSLIKLQLVGVTAMFIASKYEEIIAPSVEQFVYMTGNGYTRDEILKGERIILQTLEFRVSHYCSPYSWMRKISKADDYDVQTRTLSKFLTEVTLLDHHFLGVKPSLVAAIGMYTARRMLQGPWDAGFVHYSGYTEEYLLPGYQHLINKLNQEGFEKQYVVKKYANKKFLKASLYALEYAKVQLAGAGQEMGVGV